ncbi:PREDICTED: uncharacterized protein CG4449 [Polistes dominula]|uniref:Uncharacterized protein CG4449 n=1 Tax=Polistes dominula TaxID=743375 RepID=A0ABM1I8T8_POLDO|nr:PREDICTED: uncharacterized protein CG4449 [Polistes dominula]
MNNIELDISSEEDDDDYVNSVARLKALQNEVVTNHKELQTNNNENKGRGRERGRRQGQKRGRGRERERGKNKGRQKNTKDSLITCDLTEDLGFVEDNLEIISVPDENVIHTRSYTSKQKKVDDIIILNCSSEEEEDFKKDVEDLEKHEDFDVNVKILWRSKVIHRLNINNHENFRKVFQYFADMEKVSIEQILIMKKDKRINLADTPSSLGLSIIDILEGGIVDASIISQNDHQNQQKIIEEDICQIKVQTANKESLVIPLKKNQQFQILIASCAREWNVTKSSIKLYFDGDPINNNDTPESLDLEQEACIDLRIIKS